VPGGPRTADTAGGSLSRERRMRGILWCIAVAAALGAAPDGAAARQSSAEPQRSARDGIYSASLADRGEETFRRSCGACHSPAEFTGPTFEVNWGGLTAFDIFEQLRTTMPMDNPGGLTRQEYLDVVSYLLRLNGYPAGESPLDGDDDALKRIGIPVQGGG